MNLLGNLKKGLLFILSAPAGTGKTTLIQRLVSEFPSVVASISSTTRKPRENELEGVHYHFLTIEEFERKIQNGDFLEFVTLYGDYYGTSQSWVQQQLKKGKHVVLVIDTQGALNLMRKGLGNAIFIFMEPPSFEELEQRLRSRQTDSADTIEKRLEWAKRELLAAEHYDYVIVNEDLDIAYQVLISIFIAEEHRVRR